jgi:hypothetical protein
MRASVEQGAFAGVAGVPVAGSGPDCSEHAFRIGLRADAGGMLCR